MRWLHNIFDALGLVLLSPLFLYKMWKRGKCRENFWQRSQLLFLPVGGKY